MLHFDGGGNPFGTAVRTDSETEARAPSGAEDLPWTLARNEGTFLVSQGALASAKVDTGYPLSTGGRRAQFRSTTDIKKSRVGEEGW